MATTTNNPSDSTNLSSIPQNIHPVYTEIQKPKYKKVPSKVYIPKVVNVDDGVLKLNGEEYQSGTPYDVNGDKVSYQNHPMSSKGGNLRAQLKDYFAHSPGGPLFLDGRDGDINIHGLNFNQKPIATYSWKGGSGELLRFHIQTKKKNKLLKAITASKIDPENKQLTTTTNQIVVNTTADARDGAVVNVNGNLIHARDLDVNNADRASLATSKIDRNNANYSLLIDIPNTGLQSYAGRGNSQLSQGRDITNPHDKLKSEYKHAMTPEEAASKIKANYTPTSEDASQYIATLKPQFLSLLSEAEKGTITPLLKINSMNKFKVKRKVYVKEEVYPGNLNEDIIRRSGSDDEWYEAYNNLRADPSIYIIPNKALPGGEYSPRYNGGKVNIMHEKILEVEVDGSRVLTAVTPQQITDMFSENTLTEQTQKQVVSDFKTIGFPIMESSMVINVNNVSSRYSGNWYIIKAKHHINGSGYFVEGECIMAGIPSTVSSVKTSVNTQKLYNDIMNLSKRKNKLVAGLNIASEVTVNKNDAKFVNNETPDINNPETWDNGISAGSIVEISPSGDKVRITTVKAKHVGVNVTKLRKENRDKLNK